MTLTNLRISNYSEPTGIDMPPRVSWEYLADGCGGHQRSYRITVCTDPSFADDSAVYDGGTTDSPLQSADAVFPMRRHTRYYLRVETTDENGKTMTAGTSFVTGITDGWKGKWITAGSGKPFFAARHFLLGKEVKEAFCSVCGLGQFVLSLNGRKAGDHVLDPGWTDYAKSIRYVTFDVTSMLKEGENRVCAEIGAGWYYADVGGRHHYTVGFHGYRNFGEELPFIFEMTVRFSDGTEEIISSDGDWRVCPSPTTLANIYGSEDYDARLEPENDDPYCDPRAFAARFPSGGNLPKGELLAQAHPPVKIIRSYSVKSTSEYGGAKIYDFGQNMSGLFEIKVRGKSGQRVRMIPAEKLTSDGDVCQSCNSFLVYTLKGAPDGESWMPRFTYSAGRWLKIECLPADGRTELPAVTEVTAHFISSSAAPAGRFECSDPRCGRLPGIIERAIESNLNHVHTDCPTVERLGWLEISNLMAPSIMYFRDADTLWLKILRDIREAQYKEGEEECDLCYPSYRYGAGMVPSIAPRYSHFIHAGDMGSFWDIVPWGSTLILGPLQQLRFYGNTDVISECYEPAKAYMKFLTAQYDNYNEIYGKTGKEKFLRHGLGDWGVLKEGTQSRENVETAFFFHDLTVLAGFADRLGKPDDRDALLATAERVRSDYNAALLKKDAETGDWFYNMYSGDGSICMVQTNQALPLCFGIVPEDRCESVVRSFLRTAECRQINSGEIGLRYILQLLNSLDRNDIVYDMIMQPEHPSYIRFIDKGETTLPEYWEDDARSHNHTMMGHIYEWFYSGAAGITSEDGYRHIRIAPRPPEKLGGFRCIYHSAAGVIEEEVSMSGGLFEMKLTLPANTETDIEIPSGYSGGSVTCDGETASRLIHISGGGRFVVRASRS